MSCAHRSVRPTFFGLIATLATLAVASLVSCGFTGNGEAFFVQTVSAERGPRSGHAEASWSEVTTATPFEFLDKDGTPDGFNIEVLRGVAAIMDLDITVELTEWNEARRVCDSGEGGHRRRGDRRPPGRSRARLRSRRGPG
ncbi:MAG: transporter substrate-binding domain-containing protein [Spirochaetota bacterium]